MTSDPHPLDAPITRISRVYPAPTLDPDGIPVNWFHTSEVEEDWGWIRIVIDGVDRTYWSTLTIGKKPCLRASWSMGEPFGCGAGQLTLPTISPYQVLPAWLSAGKAVDIVHLTPAGTATVLWSGEIASGGPTIDQTSRRIGCDLIGDLWAGDAQTHKPPQYRTETSIGVVIADTLNGIVNRRIAAIARANVDISTSSRGSNTDSPIAFVQQLLATATNAAGTTQLTVARTPGVPRSYRMAWKDATTVAWTVRFGQPGVQISLHRDPRDAPNRIYGSGTGPTGYAWANWKYPNYTADSAPSYPFADPGTVMTVGTTDADTSSGDGVSTWQARVNGLGITGAKVKVDGVYDSADASAARVVQHADGILVDGVVGPQTWAASFNVGANGVDLDGAFRMPLAWDPRAMPRLLNADGSDAGANPAWDPTILVVDRDEDMGNSITKAQATRSAQAELARTPTPGWVGEIVLTADPIEGSRLDIREGQNIRVLGHLATDVVLHIAQVSVQDDRSVRLTVDEHYRDLVTLAGILSRDKESATDPARMPARKYRRRFRENVVDFDGESPAGVVPDFALFGGLWSVIHIPVSQTGQVASIRLQTHGPMAKFSVAFFGDSVTAAQMVSLVGNPLIAHGNYGPYDHHRPDLELLGFINAIGGPGQAAGYSQDTDTGAGSGYETSPYTGSSTLLTGWLVDTASWAYTSVRPPWLWLAFYSDRSTRIRGRLLPAPPQQ